MQRSSVPFEVPDIYSHTAATVPANPHSVMVGGKQIPRLFSRNTLRIKPRSVRGTD